MKNISSFLIILYLSCPLYAFIDIGGVATSAKEIALLEKMVSSLDKITGHSKRQEDGIEKMYTHYDTLEYGKEFVSIFSDIFDSDALDSANDVFDKTEDVLDILSEANKNGEVVYPPDSPILPQNAFKRINLIQGSRKEIADSKQSAAIKKGAEYNSVTAENSESIKWASLFIANDQLLKNEQDRTIEEALDKKYPRTKEAYENNQKALAEFYRKHAK